MDALASLLAGPSARNAFLLRVVMAAPWRIRVEDRAPLTVAVIVRGAAYVTYDDGESHRVHAGDIALLRGPDPYDIADDPADAVTAVVDPGGVCRTPSGDHLAERLSLGVRTWGNSPDSDALMLIGTYTCDAELSGPLLESLGRITVVRQPRDPLTQILASEIQDDSPAQSALLDRLLDLVLVRSLREHFSAPDTVAPAWFAAQSDPVIGPTLRLMQNNIAEPWTVTGLAARAGVSRAAFAKRFTQVVGEPPAAYLTRTRIAHAADLLRSSDKTLDMVAREVGYGGAFALSVAFKRVRSVSPREYRRAG